VTDHQCDTAMHSKHYVGPHSYLSYFACTISTSEYLFMQFAIPSNPSVEYVLLHCLIYNFSCNFAT
jgi:hypothetical protein